MQVRRSSGKATRLKGLGAVVIGVLLEVGYIAYLKHQASERVNEITIFRSLIVGSLALVLIGVLLLALGNRAWSIINIDSKNLSVVNVVFLLVVVVLGIGGYLWIVGILQGYGYE